MTSASRPACSSASCSRKMFPTDFAIFSPSSRTMPLCIQMRASGFSRAASVWAISFSWCGKTSPSHRRGSRSRAQDLLGHGRALDVPAGPPAPPGRVPRGVLALLLGLPQREVLRRLLQARGVVALALLHLLQRTVRELSVVGEAAHAEVDVSLRGVGVAASRSGPRSASTMASIVPVAVGSRSGRPEPEAVRVARRRRRSSRRASCSLPHAGFARGVVDLVVHVGDVRDERDVVPLVLEEALEQQEDDERPGVPTWTRP